MKINSITPKDLYGVYNNKPQGKPAVTSKESKQTDRVELSEDAIAFSAAMKAAKESMETPDINRSKRIDSIKKQIDAGTYSVSGEKIAEKMLGL